MGGVAVATHEDARRLAAIEDELSETEIDWARIKVYFEEVTRIARRHGAVADLAVHHVDRDAFDQADGVNGEPATGRFIGTTPFWSKRIHVITAPDDETRRGLLTLFTHAPPDDPEHHACAAPERLSPDRCYACWLETPEDERP